MDIIANYNDDISVSDIDECSVQNYNMPAMGLKTKEELANKHLVDKWPTRAVAKWSGLSISTIKKYVRYLFFTFLVCFGSIKWNTNHAMLR